jgi:squalene synthase HpnC
MTELAHLRSGKGARDENFPVASWLIRKRHRPVILAFYEFVRIADDIADHPKLASAEKLALLDRLESSLLGHGDEPVGRKLLAQLKARDLSTQHAQDLLSAFRQDVTKRRYANWDELIDYCSRSAMPVGRFVLDVHGETHDIWPASDALCAALQIINHLQDCQADYCNLDRVYIPLDALAAENAGVEELEAVRSSPALESCLHKLAARTASLLQKSEGLPTIVGDRRLALEISVIQSMASQLLGILQRRDPLYNRVHLNKSQMLITAILGCARSLLRLPFRTVPSPGSYQTS